MNPLTRTPLLLSMGLLCFALVFTACEPADEPEAMEDDTVMMDEPAMDDVEIRELEGDPLEYVGQTVTVDGEIDDVYGPQVFSIEGGLFSGELTVIVPQGVAMSGVAMEEDADVTIRGMVRAYVAAEIESEYGIVFGEGLDVDIEEREPILIAEQVMRGELDEM